LIDIALSCANHQLLLDMDISNGMSNLCKWIPRENKIEWLFEKLVIDWFSHFELNNNYSLSYQKKMYRQIKNNSSVNSLVEQLKSSNNIEVVLSNQLVSHLNNETVYSKLPFENEPNSGVFRYRSFDEFNKKSL
jgi:hypothetical protein